MRLFLQMEAFESAIGKDLVTSARQAFGDAVQRLMQTGKVETSGLFANGRGGVVIIDVDSEEQLLELLGDVVDFGRVEVRPLARLESLPDLFSKYPPRG